MSDEIYFTTDAFVRREVRRKNLKTFTEVSYVWPQKHSVSVDLSCSGFYFYEHFDQQFTHVVFYIQNRDMCLSNNNNISLFFCLAWESFSTILLITHFNKSMFLFANPWKL